MAKTVRDAKMDSRAARERLASQGKPHYRIIEPGLHLGYRKPKSGSGKWVARHYENGKYEVELLAIADDFSDADGISILNYRQAQECARSRMVQRSHASAGKTGPVTVQDAMNDYLEWFLENRRSGVDTKKRADAFIIPELGDIELEKLTADDIRQWHSTLAKQARRTRTKSGKSQQHRAVEDSDKYRQRRRSSANRVLTILKAALNRAWKAGRVTTDGAWRRVEPFENVDAARQRHLSVDEARRFIQACADDFRPIAEAALQTGARYGELSRLDVKDFNPDSGTVEIRQSKSGKPRYVVLTEEGSNLFRFLADGRGRDEPLLPKADGTRWGASHQNRPMAAACIKANIEPISFHGLRHTWATLSVMNGVPLLVVARNLGHSDTRMVEKHYGHLSSSYIAEAIRANAPRFAAQN